METQAQVVVTEVTVLHPAFLVPQLLMLVVEVVVVGCLEALAQVVPEGAAAVRLLIYQLGTQEPQIPAVVAGVVELRILARSLVLLQVQAALES